MMENVITSRLEELNDSANTIYQFTRHYTEFDPEFVPLVAIGRESLKRSQKIFVNFLAKHFNKLINTSRSELFQSVTAYLLAQVVVACGLSNEMSRTNELV